MRTARDTRRLHPLSNTFFGFILLAITAVILTGCGSSGGSNPSNPVITGVVVDEYVRDATVTAYADRGLSRVIGTGNTDENGNFRITLDVDELPEILYLKSVGGFNLDTGLPAPTMLFVGRGSLERFAITPITDSIYWASVRTDLDNALQDMADRLGLSLEALYDDPMAQGHMDAVDKVLASGTQTGTLPDGTYTGTLLYLEERNLAGRSDAHAYDDIDSIDENNSHELTIQIQDGEISGELDEGDDITGRVQGSSMLLSVVAHDDDTHEVVEVAQVAGSIGLMGSVSGHYLHADLLDEGNPEVVRGFFVASFQPAQGVDFAKMEELVSTVYEGEHDMLFRDVLGADREQLSGMLEVVSADFDGTFSIDANVHDVSFANGTLIDMKTEEGEFVSLSEPTKTGLAVLEVTVDAEDKAYLLQAVGNRRGIFLAVDDTDKATAIGEFYASSSKGITPGVLPETNDSLRLAVADPAMIGNSLESILLDRIVVGDAFLDLMDRGNIRAGTYADGTFLLELAETGAVTGEFLGDAPGDRPEPLVGFVTKDGESAPGYEGRMNFMARVLYSNWESEDLDLVYLEDVFAYGSMELEETSALIQLHVETGWELETTAVVSNEDGILHLSGIIDPFNNGDDISELSSSIFHDWHIDLFWPIGAPKGFFVSSIKEEEDSEFIVDFIGELYMSR